MAPVRIKNKRLPLCEFCDRKPRLRTCVLCEENVVRLCCAGVLQGVTECVCTSCFVSVPRAWYRASHLVRSTKRGTGLSLKGRIDERQEHLDAFIDLVWCPSSNGSWIRSDEACHHLSAIHCSDRPIAPLAFHTQRSSDRYSRFARSFHHRHAKMFSFVFKLMCFLLQKQVH